jgi:hypothetical protein
LAAVLLAAALGLAPAAGLGAASPSPVSPVLALAATAGSWTTLGESRVSWRPTSLANRVREPIIAANPLNRLRLAAVFPVGPGEESHPVVRISHDGGRTWSSRSAHLYGGGSHPMVAWGPGPRPGSTRLYYTAMGGSPNNYHFEVSHSDNEGQSWHLDYVADNTRGWFGGIADLMVDANKASPNYGAVYLAYNWPKDPARGTGLRVAASGDYGRHWAETEIPKLTPPRGYGDAFRISYKLATAPDGAAYVEGYQLDMRSWLFGHPFWKGGSGNVGRIAFGVARLQLNRTTRRLVHGPNVLVTTLPETLWNLGYALAGVNVSLVEPNWATGMVVDEGGRIYFAVGVDGRIRLMTSDDRGRTWHKRALPQAPSVNGRAQRSTRPDLVAGPGFVAVLFHTVDAAGLNRTFGTAAAVSFNGGSTWVGPRAVTRHRWRINPIIAIYNGPGLRDRAAVLADGSTIYFAYGDGRDGLTGAFGARIRVTRPVVDPPPPPPPSESPSPSPSPSEPAAPAG